MDWKWLIALNVLSGAIALTLQRKIIREDKTNPIAFSAAFMIIVGLIIFVFGLFQGMEVSNLWAFWPNLLLMIALYAGANVLWFSALKKEEVSWLSVLLTSRGIWIAIGAVLFLGERITSLHIWGIILIFSAIVIASYDRQNKFKLNAPKILALGAGACYGFAFVNDVFLIKQTDIYFYLPLIFILPGLAIWGLYPSATSDIKKTVFSTQFWGLLLVCIFYATTALTIYIATQQGSHLNQIGPIGQTVTILTIILAAIFLKERKNLFSKVIGGILSVLGVILTIL